METAYDADKLWRNARSQLISCVGEIAFAQLLAPLVALEDDGEELVLGAPNSMIANLAGEIYGEAMGDICGRRVRVITARAAAHCPGAELRERFRGRR